VHDLLTDVSGCRELWELDALGCHEPHSSLEFGSWEFAEAFVGRVTVWPPRWAIRARLEYITMNQLEEFFKGGDTKFGVFYPTHHLLAVFQTPAHAAQTVEKLWAAGFAKTDAVAADGAEVLALGEGHGLASYVMQSMSRFFSTEQKFTDDSLEHARNGAGFLAVRCPTDDVKNSAWAIVKTENPLDARYYTLSGIEHLAGDANTD
jgi:hypothetical protein